MAKKEETMTDKTKVTESDITRFAPRRMGVNKVNLHRYYKGIIALQKTPEQRAASKRMWIGLLKEVGPYAAG